MSRYMHYKEFEDRMSRGEDFRHDTVIYEGNYVTVERGYMGCQDVRNQVQHRLDARHDDASFDVRGIVGIFDIKFW